MSLTLFDKIWERHLVGVRADGKHLLYMDRGIILILVTLLIPLMGHNRTERIPYLLQVSSITLTIEKVLLPHQMQTRTISQSDKQPKQLKLLLKEPSPMMLRTHSYHLRKRQGSPPVTLLANPRVRMLPQKILMRGNGLRVRFVL